MQGYLLRILPTALVSVFLIANVQADQTEAFLAKHWQRPLSHQGVAPSHYSALEGSLAADACGSCHPQQHSDWSQSLHSRSMGPGLMGQLIDLPAHARDDHQSCLRCHAPLAEQADTLATEITLNPASEPFQNTSGSKQLHRQGLVCAACHVRQQQHFGPARRDGSIPAPGEPLPHNGWIANDAFEDSRFCAACHQFEQDGFTLNGKVLENTYNEWLGSTYAEQGISCQNCHMPERRHLWRGIHDAKMVRQGVTIQAQLENTDDLHAEATLSISNSGTGHRFPTYVTPQVVLEAYQENNQAEHIEGTESYFVVARRVALDLSEEIFDTRLTPGETVQLAYREPRSAEAVNIVMRIWVEPDFFYQQFYASVLGAGEAKRGEPELRQALIQASNSRYTLFEQRLPLDPHRLDLATH